MVESLKAGVSKDSPSILWYHYFNGIGEYLIENDLPMPIASFTNKLATSKVNRWMK